jgi:hypothetical protein
MFSLSFVWTPPEHFPQGFLLSWTKKFKARGVQDTDVVSRLASAMKKHKVRDSPGCRDSPSPSPFSLGAHYYACLEGQSERDLAGGALL